MTLTENINANSAGLITMKFFRLKKIENVWPLWPKILVWTLTVLAIYQLVTSVLFCHPWTSYLSLSIFSVEDFLKVLE